MIKVVLLSCLDGDLLTDFCPRILGNEISLSNSRSHSTCMSINQFRMIIERHPDRPQRQINPDEKQDFLCKPLTIEQRTIERNSTCQHSSNLVEALKNVQSTSIRYGR